MVKQLRDMERIQELGQMFDQLGMSDVLLDEPL
jgi:hypothetical protein